MHAAICSFRRLAPFAVLAVLVACAGGTTTGPSAQAESDLRTFADGGVSPHADIETIVMGSGHMCALLRDSTVRCWGGLRLEPLCDPCGCRNVLGAGTWNSLERSIPGLQGVVDLAASNAHTCAVIRDGSLRCWGGDESILATGANNPVAPIDGIGDVVQVSTRHLETCALLRSGQVRCWGGPIKSNDPNNFVPGWFGVDRLTSSDDDETNGVTCMSSRDGTVACRSIGMRCVDRRESRLDTYETQQFFLESLQGVTELTAGANFVCGIRNGAARCVDNHDRDPSVVASANDAGRIATSAGVTCVVVSDGSVSCSGRASDGSFLAAQPVEGVADAVAIARGSFNGSDTCALRRDGAILCWQTDRKGNASHLKGPAYLPLEGEPFVGPVDFYGNLPCDSQNTCSDSSNLGAISGDFGSGLKFAEGSTSQWFNIRVTEDSSTALPLSMTATLVSPPSANFDLFVYVPALDTVECSSLSAASTQMSPTDRTQVAFGERVGWIPNGQSNSRTVTIEVRHVSGACNPSAKWKLTIEGNTGRHTD